MARMNDKQMQMMLSTIDTLKVGNDYRVHKGILESLLQLAYQEGNLDGDKTAHERAMAAFGELTDKPERRHMHVKDDDAGDSCKTCGRDLRDEIHLRMGERNTAAALA